MNPAIKKAIRNLLPKNITKKRIQSGGNSGQWIVTSWFDYPAAIIGYTEKPLLNWFEKNTKTSETWLDIGAHYGFTAIALAKLVGKSGRVFAFEPMLSTAGYLDQTRKLNNYSQIIVLPFGLAAENEMSMQLLPVVRGMVDSTVDKANADWFESLLIISLDALWPRVCNQNNQIHGIKIDVQGMEIEALKGMKNILLEQHPKLAIEVHDGVDRNELVDFLETVGYSKDAIPIEPVVGEEKAQLISNRSYEFLPIGTN
jgi:FkbM family methyltransferase